MKAEQLIPLKEEAFQILLTLLEGVSHGYAIMQRIEERTENRMSLLPGVLYRHLHRMLENGMVTEVSSQKETENDPRRRYYTITELGRQTCSLEAERLKRLVVDAEAFGLIERTG